MPTGSAEPVQARVDLRVPASRIAAWAAPAVPVYFAVALVTIYFLKFGTDVLGVPPGLLGLILGSSQLGEAIARPFVGFLSDRTRHRLGRRRSWILFAGIPFAISCLMVWAPPSGLAGGWLAAWLGLGLIVLALSQAGLEVPRAALPVELSRRSADRTRMFALNGVATAVSSLAALTLGIGWLRTASEPRVAAFGLAAGLAALCLVSVAWLVASVREPPENLGRGGASLLRSAGTALRNPFQQRLMLQGLLAALPMGSMSVLAPYLFQYTLERPNLTEAYMVAFFVPHLASVWLWVWLARRFAKLRLLIASLVLTAIAYLSMAAVFGSARAEPVPSPLLLLLAPILLGVAMGCDVVVPPAMRAEVVDYDELISGERKEGVYTAMSTLVFKLGNAISIALAGYALELSGFRRGAADQPEAVGTAILWAVTLVPAFFVLCSILPLLRFRLDEREHERILRELEARRRAGAAPRAAYPRC
jgi:GPH family glycoside/pentoside/hexuronide:cation symporter